MKRQAGLLAAITAFAGHAAAQEIDVERIVSEPRSERFSLWTDCQPVMLLNRINARGLTEEIPNLVEGRLRSARFYSETLSEVLLIVDVDVDVVSGFQWYVRLAILKFFFDPLSGEDGAAITWRRSDHGSGDAERARSVLSDMLDEFIAEYLRVNADACD